MSETTETFEPKDEEMEADTSSSEEYADFDLNQTLEYDVPEKRDFLGRRWLAKDEWADRMRAVYLYKTSGALPRQARKRSYIKELSKNFSALKGHLYKKKMVRGIPTDLEVIINTTRQQTILHSLHCGIADNIVGRATGGHIGVRALQHKLASRYFWMRSTQDIRRFIAGCEGCQRSKLINLQKIQEELHSIPVPYGKCWHQLGVDLMKLPEVKGYNYVLTAVCYFTKWVELVPLKRKEGGEVALALFKLMCRHGSPAVIITDQGREFVNYLSTKLFSLSGTRHRITSAYHPQANGLVERQNRTTTSMIKASLENYQGEWLEILDSIQMGINASRSESTGYSPFYLMCGREMKQFVETDADVPLENQPGLSDQELAELESQTSEEKISSHIQFMQRALNDACDRAREQQERVQKKNKMQYDKRHSFKTTLKKGDIVWRRNMQQANRKGGKLEDTWLGPYKIVDVDTKHQSYGLQKRKKTGEWVPLKTKVPVKHLKKALTPYTVTTLKLPVTKEEAEACAAGANDSQDADDERNERSSQDSLLSYMGVSGTLSQKRVDLQEELEKTVASLNNDDGGQDSKLHKIVALERALQDEVRESGMPADDVRSLLDGMSSVSVDCVESKDESDVQNLEVLFEVAGAPENKKPAEPTCASSAADEKRCVDGQHVEIDTQHAMSTQQTTATIAGERFPAGVAESSSGLSTCTGDVEFRTPDGNLPPKSVRRGRGRPRKLTSPNTKPTLRKINKLTRKRKIFSHNASSILKEDLSPSANAELPTEPKVDAGVVSSSTHGEEVVSESGTKKSGHVAERMPATSTISGKEIETTRSQDVAVLNATANATETVSVNNAIASRGDTTDTNTSAPDTTKILKTNHTAQLTSEKKITGATLKRALDKLPSSKPKQKTLRLSFSTQSSTSDSASHTTPRFIMERPEDRSDFESLPDIPPTEDIVAELVSDHPTPHVNFPIVSTPWKEANKTGSTNEESKVDIADVSSVFQKSPKFVPNEMKLKQKETGIRGKRDSPLDLTESTPPPPSYKEIIAAANEEIPVFRPVTLCQRRDIARVFGIPWDRKKCLKETTVKWKKEKFQQSGPGEVVKTGGDGNCYYRALSWVATGLEDHHRQIRNSVADYIAAKANFEKMFPHFDEETGQEYVVNNRTRKLGVYATNVEISATAMMIGRDVWTWVHHPVNYPIPRWVVHPAAGFGGNESKTKTAVYLANINEHFQPVVKT